MNSIIARLFVYINEVLSIFIIAVAFFGGLASMSALGFWGGLLATSLSLMVLISIFGFAAVMIENHKVLVEIRDMQSSQKKPLSSSNTSKPSTSNASNFTSTANLGEIKCAKCGEISVEEADECWSCGAKFK